MSHQDWNRDGALALVHAFLDDGSSKEVHVAEVEDVSRGERGERDERAHPSLLVLIEPLRQGELFEVRGFAPDGSDMDPRGRAYGILAASHWLFATGRASGDEIEFRSSMGDFIGKSWAKRVGERITVGLPGPLRDGRADPMFVQGTARIVHEGPPRGERPKAQPSATLLATTMPESCGDGVVLTPILPSPDLPTKVPFFVGSFTLAPHCASDPHSHASAEIWYIASGSGRVLSGGREIRVRRGDFVYLTPQTTHRIENTGDEPLEATSVCWSC